MTDKLAAKAQKVAYFLLNKLGGGKLVQPGDKVHVHVVINSICCYFFYSLVKEIYSFFVFLDCVGIQD